MRRPGDRGRLARYTADFGPGFRTRVVNIDRNMVSVTLGESGPPIVLLHGYAEDSRMWKPLAAVLAPHRTVIAPDLPGIGNSSIPSAGLDMSTSARCVREAVHALKNCGHWLMEERPRETIEVLTRFLQ